MRVAPELHGSINHVAITVSDLNAAMDFFGPLLQALGYTVGEPMPYKETRLTVSVNDANGAGINLWEANEPHPFRMYEPGLHHLAFNVAPRAAVDEIAELVKSLGGRIQDGPGEFPYARNGYYAVYFLGPDDLKLEVVHMAALETAISQGRAGEA